MGPFCVSSVKGLLLGGKSEQQNVHTIKESHTGCTGWIKLAPIVKLDQIQPNLWFMSAWRAGEQHKKLEAKTTSIIQTSNNKRERRPSKKLLSASAPATLTSNNLLGNFEESVLNGRLEPNSTVEGFTAEIGASGSFQPKHKTLPVTVFFYTLCDNAAYSSPYLGN